MINVFIDARCYQDPDYAQRGIGRSTLALLRRCPAPLRAGLKFIALCDSALPLVSAEAAEVFDETRFAVRSARKRAIFFNPSPLTHPSLFTAPLLSGPATLRTAYVHDLIPYDSSEGFAGARGYVDYRRSLQELKRYDLFFTNSFYTRERLAAVLNLPLARIERCGIAPRPGFVGAEERPLDPFEAGVLAPVLRAQKPLFASIAGEAPRKNIETALAAVRILNERLRGRYRLAIAGRYGSEKRERLSALYPQEAVFVPEISDEALAVLLRRAIAVLVPSRIEGFSLPLVETIAAGGLVLASDIAAHRELVACREALFPADNAEELADRMGAIAADPALRARLIAAERRAIEGLTEEAVGERFWSRLIAEFASAPIAATALPVPAIAGAARPLFAFLSPYAPQYSGIALGCTHLLKALSEKAVVDLFTERQSAAPEHPYLRWIRSLETARNLRGYDAVVYVLGNSNFHHGEIYRLSQSERCGDYCLLGDSVMVDMQYERRGPEGAAQYAGRILGREVSAAEYRSWLARPLTLPILGQEEFLADGWRPIVYSRPTQAEMERRSGAAVRWVPHPVTASFEPQRLTARRRVEARLELGFSDDEITIVTAGVLTKVKGPVESVVALRDLADWGLRPRLVFIGPCQPALQKELEALAESYGVGGRVSFAGQLDRARYEDHILAADVGLQLRKVPFGQTSGGLADCIAGGLATVANRAMAAAIDAPSYVSTVPDLFSPLLIAEKIAETADRSRRETRSTDEERLDYVEAHSPAKMADGFLDLIDW